MPCGRSSTPPPKRASRSTMRWTGRISAKRAREHSSDEASGGGGATAEGCIRRRRRDMAVARRLEPREPDRPAEFGSQSQLCDAAGERYRLDLSTSYELGHRASEMCATSVPRSFGDLEVRDALSPSQRRTPAVRDVCCGSGAVDSANDRHQLGVTLVLRDVGEVVDVHPAVDVPDTV